MYVRIRYRNLLEIKRMIDDSCDIFYSLALNDLFMQISPSALLVLCTVLYSTVLILCMIALHFILFRFISHLFSILSILLAPLGAVALSGAVAQWRKYYCTHSRITILLFETFMAIMYSFVYPIQFCITCVRLLLPYTLNLIRFTCNIILILI